MWSSTRWPGGNATCHSERSSCGAKNLSEEHAVAGEACLMASVFADQHGRSVCRMCTHHAHNGSPHLDGPLPPSVPAGSRHASCGTAHYRGLYSQPPLGKNRRKQACLSAGTGARSSRHWRMPLPPTDAGGAGHLDPCASSPGLWRAAFGVTPSGVVYPPAAAARGTAVCSGFTPQGAENQPPGTCHGCKRRDASRRRRTAVQRVRDDCPAGAFPPKRSLGRDVDCSRHSARPNGLRMTRW